MKYCFYLWSGLAMDANYSLCYILARASKNELMKRVQRKRTKGFKLPENTKCVNRGTKWGNPFKVLKEDGDWVVKDQEGNYWGKVYDNKDDASQKAVECYSGYIDAQIGMKKLDLSDLKGKNLACFCSLSSPCHADYLLELLK